jgi:hypothetical protein
MKNKISIKSCKYCQHFEMCNWVPVPYNGSHSGGYLPRTSYESFHKDYYSVFGNNCSRFELEKRIYEKS